jgi:alpha-L-fucosidase 2
MESLPLGNGRIGAMVYGGLETETVALNEITLWSGGYDEDQENFCGKDILAEIRKEFFEGRIDKGNDLATRFLAGTPHSFGSHQPLGDLKIMFDYDYKNAKDYMRELDIRKGVATVSFKIDKTTYSREYFCSNPGDALVFRYTSDNKGALSAMFFLNLFRHSDLQYDNDEISFSGEFQSDGKKNGVAYLGKVKVISKNGKSHFADNKLEISDADEITVYVDIRTDYKQSDFAGKCDRTVKDIAQRKYASVKEEHIKDFSQLFNRVELNLGNSESDNLPTDVRWTRLKEGKGDVGLDALFFQYGRYLLISSSRENSPLPANLQGVWNDNLANNMGWNCDYHLDINTQQNYWPANITNLHECSMPLFNYIEDLSVYGEKTARKVYGSPGWVAHTIANVWGFTASGQINWGLFPTASCWIASHLWEHYRYTRDKEFLRNKAYPILKKNAMFFLDYMVENPTNGYLMTGPGTSPENTFLFKGKHLSVSMMPTCDKVLVTEIYNACIEGSEILGIDAGFRDELRASLKKFPPFKIGKNGGVQEWFEDYDEAHPNHRHTTHLLALYPYSQITLEKSPDLAKAARRTIYLRETAEGWEDVEWSRANLICNYARLKDAKEAYKSVGMLQRDFTRENLLSISPKGIAGAPYDLFILDGNTAAAAGMAEMLLQAHEGYIEFLPALPEQWKNGYFKGLCVPGGATVDLSWENGYVKNAVITITADNKFGIKRPNSKLKLKLMKNKKLMKQNFNENGVLILNLKKGDILKISE